MCATTVRLGCGKTLMARQIGNMLQAREPKIVNGPGTVIPHTVCRNWLKYLPNAPTLYLEK